MVEGDHSNFKSVKRLDIINFRGIIIGLIIPPPLARFPVSAFASQTGTCNLPLGPVILPAQCVVWLRVQAPLSVWPARM